MLYLVGAVHSDLKGPKRLRKILDKIMPSDIASEADCENTKHYLDANKKILEKFETSDDILEKRIENYSSAKEYIYCRLFEVWVPIEFKFANPETRIHYLGEAQSLYSILNYLGYNFDPASFFDPDVQLNLLLDEFKLINRFDADILYDDDSISDDPELHKLGCLDVDEALEPKIRSLIKNVKGDTVFIAGILHIFGDYHNLYDRLSDLTPQRIKLKDADNY